MNSRGEKKQTWQWRAVNPVKAADSDWFDSNPKAIATEEAACSSSKHTQPILGATVSDAR